MKDEQPDFWKEESEDDDGKLPPDHYRKCNRCGQLYWCRVTRSRPTYIPMHCDRCAAVAAEDLLRRTEIWGAKMRSGELRWKKRLAGDKPWEKNPDWGKPSDAGKIAAEGFDAILSGVADDVIKRAEKQG